MNSSVHLAFTDFSKRKMYFFIYYLIGF